MREPREDEEAAVERDMPERLVEEGQRRRLAEAFAGEVAEVGYEAATPKSVAARAGLPVARFEAIFGRKQACFAAVYDAAVRRLLARMDAAMATPEASQDRLQSGIDALVGWCVDEPRAARLCIVDVVAAGTGAQRRRERTMLALAAKLEPPLRDLRPTDRLAQLGARAIVGAAHELMYAALASGSGERLPELGRDLVSVQGAAVAA